MEIDLSSCDFCWCFSVFCFATTDPSPPPSFIILEIRWCFPIFSTRGGSNPKRGPILTLRGFSSLFLTQHKHLIWQKPPYLRLEFFQLSFEIRVRGFSVVKAKYGKPLIFLVLVISILFLLYSKMEIFILKKDNYVKRQRICRKGKR